MIIERDERKYEIEQYGKIRFFTEDIDDPDHIIIIDQYPPCVTNGYKYITKKYIKNKQRKKGNNK